MAKVNKKSNSNKKESKLDNPTENDSSSDNSSESESDIKPKQKNKIMNRFNLIASDSESDAESDDGSESVRILEPVNESIEIIEKVDDCVLNSNINLEKMELMDKTEIETVGNESGPKVNKKLRDEFKKNKREKRNKINTTNEDKKVIKNSSTIFSDKVEILINGKVLIGESNITINDSTKYVVIGQNGAGKTTLLKYLYEKLKEKDVLMIEQDIELEDSENKVRDFILGAKPDLYIKFKRFRELELKEDLTDQENDEYQEISQELADEDWDRFDAESKRILSGLGFSNPELPVSILSGGWRMRLALGKALLRCPSLLILDEPTNHLDLDAVIWLTDYLSNYKNSLIVITHQIHLINAISQVIWYIGDPEMTGIKIYTVNGNYFRVQKMIEMMGKEVEKNYEKFNKRVEELRRKSTPKKDVDEFIKKEGVPRPPKPYEVNIDFEKVNELSSSNIIDLREVSYSYGDTTDKQIFDSINYAMSLGSKNILVGPNGIGKTTLFKLASGVLEPNSGYILRDDRLRVGYYHQQIIDNLPLNSSPIQYLQSINSQLDNNKCRSILGRLGIKKTDTVDLPNTKISILSGGQKARVSLASIQMQNPHLILMDEPTNHLDSESIEGLIKGINEFNGGVIIITHDMYLIESIENGIIYEIKNKKVNKFNGSFDEYCDKILSI
jgi:ATPase subunit of ABC transporter with duplicated ATPase domains